MIERKSLQLKEFNDFYLHYDDSVITCIYDHNENVFYVELSVPCRASVFDLVTQKNKLRSFGSMKALYNALTLESFSSVTLVFKSNEK